MLLVVGSGLTLVVLTLVRGRLIGLRTGWCLTRTLVNGLFSKLVTIKSLRILPSETMTSETISATFAKEDSVTGMSGIRPSMLNKSWS